VAIWKEPTAWAGNSEPGGAGGDLLGGPFEKTALLGVVGLHAGGSVSGQLRQARGVVGEGTDDVK
jgi:hypothetical protein